MNDLINKSVLSITAANIIAIMFLEFVLKSQHIFIVAAFIFLSILANLTGWIISLKKKNRAAAYAFAYFFIVQIFVLLRG